MYSSLTPGNENASSAAPPGDIVDLLTLLRPAAFVDAAAVSSPSGNAPAVAGLLALLDRHRVLAAAALNVGALHHDAPQGNQETLALCQGHPRLYPAFVLDPRLPDPAAHDTTGARLLCLLPATQQYPAAFAPIRRLLRGLQEAGRNVPLLFEANRPGDATAFATMLAQTGYDAPVLLSDVSSAHGATLAEALAVAQEFPNVLVATDGLRGVGEVGVAVRALGANRIVFASGAPDCSLGASLALVRHARLSPSDEAQILGGNARRLLGDPMQSAAALIDGPATGQPGEND